MATPFRSWSMSDALVGCTQNKSMKKELSCDLCEVTAEGETFEEWMQALMPHYKDAHPDVMNDETKTEADRDAWMKENKERFDAA